MPKARWNGVTLAESDRTELVEGNHYFPPETVNHSYLRDSDRTTHCPWKGDAQYYDIVVDGNVNPAAAWYYPETKPEARHFEGYVAFWNGVQVED